MFSGHSTFEINDWAQDEYQTLIPHSVAQTGKKATDPVGQHQLTFRFHGT